MFSYTSHSVTCLLILNIYTLIYICLYTTFSPFFSHNISIYLYIYLYIYLCSLLYIFIPYIFMLVFRIISDSFFINLNNNTHLHQFKY